ncbi:uncharacterized protein LOC133711118 [Rosa rugosa]|uniref:uncharacterized protein LOC133711118 n=1 Tax=Rosa rugosa TaxID=74645 RepID=UPI002B40B525|nr:uncharacterized protein LOC133711118 [Rosa rugosa]
MGPVKCAYLALLLFLSAACLWKTSDAHSPRQLEGNAAVTRIQAVSTVNGDHIQMVSPPDIATKENRLGGRKLAVQKVKAVNGATAVRSSNQLEGNCGGDQVKQGSHVECNQQSGTGFEGVDESGFVAFNEDYHAPRHHPPKNN